jgi:hypothetical protein
MGGTLSPCLPYATEVLRRLAIEGREMPERLDGFIDSYTGRIASQRCGWPNILSHNR